MHLIRHHHPAHRALLTLAALLAATVTSQARLGETPDQCRARYGEPIVWNPEKEDQGNAFLSRGFLVTLEFLPDAAGQLRASVICYVRLDPDTNQAQPMSPREISAFLHINGAESWPEWAGSGQRYGWMSPAGDVAVYSDTEHALIIGTKAAQDATLKRSVEATKKQLEGF